MERRSRRDEERARRGFRSEGYGFSSFVLQARRAEGGLNLSARLARRPEDCVGLGYFISGSSRNHVEYFVFFRRLAGEPPQAVGRARRLSCRNTSSRRASAIYLESDKSRMERNLPAFIFSAAGRFCRGCWLGSATFPATQQNRRRAFP
jgi:hypothetical protein